MELRGIVRSAGIAAAVGSLWLPGCSRNVAPATVSAPAAYDTLSVTYGALVDARDGNTYRTVKMPDGRVWTAENLRYKTAADTSPPAEPQPGRHNLHAMFFDTPKAGTSRCYDGDGPNCDKYGRRYGWDAAAEACPAGWHLPSRREWDILGQAVGGQREYNHHISMTFWYGAGKKLKAKSGWRDCDGRDGRGGDDDYGFSALPGPAGYGAAWWAAKGTYGLSVSCRNDDMSGSHYYDDTHVQVVSGPGPISMGDGLAVRCVKDESKEDARQRIRLRAETESRRLEKISTYFTDSRDGRVYRAVEIGGERWMAENVSYQPQSPGNSWCYNDSASNCGKYGRLYDWEAALAACPPGWRLPSRRDWDDLAQAAGGERRLEDDDYDLLLNGAGWYKAGRALKARIGWDETAVGTDDYGFSALPGGGRYIPLYGGGAGFQRRDTIGIWWTAAGFDGGTAYARTLSQGGDVSYEHRRGKSGGYSVRCVQGESDGRKPKREKEEHRKREEEQRRLEKLSVRFVDSRDGRTYRAVKIGGHTWMAENLNYRTDSSWCYDNDTSNCGKYGRLYDGETAPKVCPSGWHLPSVEEWHDLTQAAGGEKKPDAPALPEERAGERLKARSGWSVHKGKSGDGTDDYGFSALPGGFGRRDAYGTGSETFNYAGNLGVWWTDDAANRRMYYGDGRVYKDVSLERDAFSVRCVADAE